MEWKSFCYVHDKDIDITQLTNTIVFNESNSEEQYHSNVPEEAPIDFLGLNYEFEDVPKLEEEWTSIRGRRGGYFDFTANKFMIFGCESDTDSGLEEDLE